MWFHDVSMYMASLLVHCILNRLIPNPGSRASHLAERTLKLDAGFPLVAVASLRFFATNRVVSRLMTNEKKSDVHMTQKPWKSNEKLVITHGRRTNMTNAESGVWCGLVMCVA